MQAITSQVKNIDNNFLIRMRHVCIFLSPNLLYFCCNRDLSSVGLERMLDRHEVGSSNLPGPTSGRFYQKILPLFPAALMCFLFSQNLYQATFMIKQLLTPQTNSAKINYTSLILRVAFGLMMIPHGYGKILSFSDYAPHFLSFMGLGSELSLALAIFAEFFCAILVVLGLGTRLAIIPLLVTMLVAFFIAHGADPFAKKEPSLIYLVTFTCIFILNAGKYSLDALIFKRSGFQA